MSRVRFVMEIYVDHEALTFVRPSAAVLRDKMNRALAYYEANHDIDPAWTRRCDIIRTIYIEDNGRKTAV